MGEGERGGRKGGRMGGKKEIRGEGQKKQGWRRGRTERRREEPRGILTKETETHKHEGTGRRGGTKGRNIYK